MKMKPSTPYTLSIIIAILATIASAGGLLLNGLYRDNAFVTTTWLGNDAITLFLAVPIWLGHFTFPIVVHTRRNWSGWVRWITCSTTTRSIFSARHSMPSS